MKFTVYSIAFLSTFVIMSSLACKKESLPERTSKDILLSKTCWQPVKYEFNDPATSLTWTDLILPCNLDDCFTYNTDGSLIYDEGASLCNPSQPRITTGNWTLVINANQQRVLTQTFNGVTDTYRIESISDTEMILVNHYSSAYLYRYTYKAK